MTLWLYGAEVSQALLGLGGVGGADGEDRRTVSSARTGAGGARRALVLGRKTYEGMAAYGQGGGARSTYMNALPKIVASRTLTAPAWNNSRAVADIAGELRAMKARTEKAIYIFGSGELMRSLLPEGVIDEIRLALVPVLLGRGTRLFGEGPQVPLRLVSSQPVPNGTMLLNYAVGVA